MDPRLSKAAAMGDNEAMGALLKEDPLILEKVALAPYAESPLHIAVLAGKADFAKEIISRMPSFARELNQDGFRPLHIASATGNNEIVRELLMLGPELCLLKDKGGRTSLHYAAIKGRVEIVKELLSKCPEAIKEVTAMGETALHLAVKNSQFEALQVLVQNLDNYNGEIIYVKDNEGNTILQVAMATKQQLVLDLLKNQISKVDKEEIVDYVKSGAEIMSQSSQINLGTRISIEPNLLKNQISKLDKDKIVDHVESGAKVMSQSSQIHSGTTISNNKQSQQQSPSTRDKSKSIWIEVEDMVLIVASLIATVTYQAGLAPPQTIWKENMTLDSKCIFQQHKGTSHTCPAVAYYLFMSFNTAGFFSSTFLIFSFRNPTFVRVLLPISLISMMITYMTLTISMSPNRLSSLIIYLLTLTIFCYCALTIKLITKIVNSIIVEVGAFVLTLMVRCMIIALWEILIAMLKKCMKRCSTQKPSSADVTTDVPKLDP